MNMPPWLKPQKGAGASLARIAGIVIAVFVAKGALAEPFYVPSASMEPTLLIGDALLASKFPYGYSTASLPIHVALPRTERVFQGLPQRGDVVVFRWPGDTSQVWVKRVVGLPGDRVQMRNGHLWINSNPVALKADGIGTVDINAGSSYEQARRFIETLPNGISHPIFKLEDNGGLDNTAEVVVPPQHVFVLGDNRDNSADSRVPLAEGGVGLLPTDYLVGRVDALVGSWNPSVTRQPLWSWLSGFRLSRFFTQVN